MTHNSECSLTDIVDDIPVVVVIYQMIEGEVRIIYTNDRYQSLPFADGLPLSSMNQEQLLSLIHPDDHEITHRFFHDIFENHETVGIDYRSNLGGDTPYRWYHLSGKPVIQKDNSTLAYVVFTDITAEKEAELSALKAKQMYQLLSDQAKQVILKYDQENKRVTFQMDNAYTRETVTSQGIPSVLENVPESILPKVDEEYREEFRSLFDPMKIEEVSRDLEYSTMVKGKQLWWRIHSIPVFAKDGHLVTVYCGIQNITERKEQEQRYQDFFDGLDRLYPNNLGSFHLNLTKNICYDGKSSLSFVMKQKESGTVDGYFKEFSKLIFDPDELSWFEDHITREKLIEKFRQGTSTISFEYTIRYPDGLHWRQALLIMNQNPQTDDIEAVTYAINIDEKKKQELVSQRIMDMQFEDVGILYLATNEFEYVRSTEVSDGIPLGVKIPCPIKRKSERDWFKDDKEWEIFAQQSELEKVKKEVRKHGSYNISYMQTMQDGKRKCHQVHFIWLEKENQSVLVVQTDVTASYEHEEKQIHEIEDALVKADKASEEKSKFLSSMSHDLRTPLNGIISFTSFALKEDDPAMIKDYLNKVNVSGNILLNLINETLELSRIESGKITVDLSPVLPRLVVQEVVTSLRPAASEKEITITEEYQNKEGKLVVCDAVKLQRIALNLISNAVKYTLDHGTVAVSTGLAEHPDGTCMFTLRVKDTGIGMSKEFLVHAFEPFSQEKRSEVQKVPGTGLGLSIVKTYVNLMKGTISIESEMHQGTDIIVKIPVELAERTDTEMNTVPQREQDDSLLKGKRILLCEDNNLNVEIAEIMLRERGILMDTAENGEMGVQKWQEAPAYYYDAILMDIQMPVMNGYEATRKIRSLTKEDAKSVPIIAMSADAFKENIRAAKDAGMDDFITKPVMPEKLFETLTRCMKK